MSFEHSGVCWLGSSPKNKRDLSLIKELVKFSASMHEVCVSNKPLIRIEANIA